VVIGLEADFVCILAKKKPDREIGLNWVRENEFRKGPEETTGLKPCSAEQGLRKQLHER
jgi:hypothetical protein